MYKIIGMYILFALLILIGDLAAIRYNWLPPLYVAFTFFIIFLFYGVQATARGMQYIGFQSFEKKIKKIQQIRAVVYIFMTYLIVSSLLLVGFFP